MVLWLHWPIVGPPVPRKPWTKGTMKPLVEHISDIFMPKTTREYKPELYPSHHNLIPPLHVNRPIPRSRQSRLPEGLRIGRVSVAHPGGVFGRGPEFHEGHRFGDDVGSARPDHVYP